MSNFVTVRQAFERAYGPIPEGATCHIGHWAGPTMTGWQMEPTIKPSGLSWPEALRRRIWGNEDTYEFIIGPDISDRPASSFVGFFGEAYDNAVRELEAGE